MYKDLNMGTSLNLGASAADSAKDRDREVRDVLTMVYAALREKGYNPISQLVGYIVSEDPTYITSHNGARAMIRKIDRDELLAALLRYYLNP